MPPVNAPPSVLFVTPQMPSFSGGGLAMRAAATLKLLSQWSADVHLIVIPIYQAGNPAEPEPAVASLVRTWQRLENYDGVAGTGSRYWSERLNGPVPAELSQWHEAWQERITSALTASPAALVVVFRFYLAPYVLPALKASRPVWLDVDELESNCRTRLAAIYACASETSGKASQALMEAKIYEALEKELLPRFDRLFAASEQEARSLRACCEGSDVRVLPNTYPFICPQPEQEPDGIARLLFVGTFGYYPNVDAILYFAKSVLPIIKMRCSLPVEISVVGSGIEHTGEHPALPGVNFVGRVEETTPFYATADGVIVPLRSGGGTRIKILEAFSHRRAVVSTYLGAEGLQVADNVQLRLADDPELFARHCLEVIQDGQMRTELARRGHDFFLAYHEPNELAKMIPQLFANGSNS